MSYTSQHCTPLATTWPTISFQNDFLPSSHWFLFIFATVWKSTRRDLVFVMDCDVMMFIPNWNELKPHAAQKIETHHNLPTYSHFIAVRNFICDFLMTIISYSAIIAYHLLPVLLCVCKLLLLFLARTDNLSHAFLVKLKIKSKH